MSELGFVMFFVLYVLGMVNLYVILRIVKKPEPMWESVFCSLAWPLFAILVLSDYKEWTDD